jgi:RNA polymerase sigma-70 factor (ECF subfamily)
MSTDESEQRRVAQARAGDRVALEQLLMTHSSMLSAHIALRLPRSLRSVLSVEDVVQEALTQAFLKIDRLREPAPRAFQAWLKAIGETTLIDAVKAQRRQKRGGELQKMEYHNSTATGSLIELLNQLPDVGVTASRQMTRREAIAALQVAMSSLPQQQRCAIQLHMIQGKSLDETAAEMNRTPAAIRGLVHRGKQALSETMGRASMWLSQR